jgi:hypothetical protein
MLTLISFHVIFYFHFVLQELQRLLSLGLMMKSTQADVAKFVRQALSKAT